MTPWPWVWLCLISFNSLADTAIKPRCQRLALVLAKTLTPAAVDTEWANGNTRNDESAVLELRGCQGELRDRMVLASSLAKLDPTPLRGTAVPTYLVSADLTAEAGSYNGPLTIAMQIVAGHLSSAVAR